ncbi:MAG: hypothetical protein HYU78_03825 [Rhodocyclales bacterium]|nr:hypothetical protein [Rhodocyclales bacterium]
MDAPCAPLPAAAEWYARLRAPSPALHAGQRVAVEVDLAASAEFSREADGSLRYGMAFNDIAEGWSWQPQARPEAEDYYRWKFLPLQSFSEEGAAYVQEEKIGVPQRTRVERRHDYFLAFDNPQAFYRRDTPEFVVRPAVPAAGDTALRLVAIARLAAPAHAESSTFWKATHARPVDFLLKKYYLIGQLEALVVCDAGSARELARIVPAGASQR